MHLSRFSTHDGRVLRADAAQEARTAAHVTLGRPSRDTRSVTGAWDSLDRPPLREAALRRALQAPDGPWRAVEVRARTGSTNADVAARARAGEPGGLVLIADHQLAGRGRLDRTWTSPPRASIAASVLLRPDAVPVHRLGWISLLGALAVARALDRVCEVGAGVKWPNDVLIRVDDEERKVCGILAEVVHGPPPATVGVVLGLGLNVTQTAAELPVPAATSLRLAGAATTDRDPVLRACLRELAARYDDFLAAGGDPGACALAEDYRRACTTLGRAVRLQLPGERVVEGVAEAVDDDGRLVVRPHDGGAPSAFAAGDVVHTRGELRPRRS